MKKTFALTICLILVAFTGIAQADFDFSGNLPYHNSVDYYYFSLATSATSVEIWTDSFHSGQNMDPITALWDSSGSLIAQNDDNPYIRPATQTYWDSGIALSSLSAGNYLFTIATYDNFANGSQLSDGFRHDGETPIPITDWRMANGQYPQSGYYHLNFAGVTSVTPPSTVPAPGAILLGSIGVSIVGWLRRKRTL